jgi:hypothetical protein
MLNFMSIANCSFVLVAALVIEAVAVGQTPVRSDEPF